MATTIENYNDEKEKDKPALSAPTTVQRPAKKQNTQSFRPPPP